jgi:hypothetical protein
MPATVTSFDDGFDDADGHALKDQDENSLAPEKSESVDWFWWQHVHYKGVAVAGALAMASTTSWRTKTRGRS